MFPEAFSFTACFALIFCRIAGLMIFAPLIGSALIPRRLRIMFAAVLTLAMVGSMPAGVQLPGAPWQLAAGLTGEFAFGAALGLALSLVFVAAQLAGAIVGQQLGFNLAGSLDPASGAGGNPFSDVYYILALFVFLLLDGHHAMMLGVRNSFDYLPPMAVGIDARFLDMITGMLMGATSLAVRVAAPACVAMLVVDLALGMIAKTIPQMNFMNIGTTLRMLVGLAVVILGLGLTATVLGGAINDGITLAERLWINAGA